MIYSNYFLHILLLQYDDIESNPEPPNEKIKNLSCCPWKVNSLLASNLTKIWNLEVYNAIYQHDFICISETYFDYSACRTQRLQFDQSRPSKQYKKRRSLVPSIKKQVFALSTH